MIDSITAESERIEQMAGQIADAAARLPYIEQDQLRRCLRGLQDALIDEPDWRPAQLIDALFDGLTQFECEGCDDRQIKGSGDLPCGWERRQDPTASDGTLVFCTHCIEEGSR